MRWLVVCVALSAASLVQGREAEDARIIASRSTKTAIVLTTSTTTTPFTCAFATNTQVCQRRRYKTFSRFQLTDELNEALLDGSKAQLEEPEDTASKRQGRLALTIWTTTSSTFTVTTTSINSSTTFSLSFYCTVSGANFPPACG